MASMSFRQKRALAAMNLAKKRNTVCEVEARSRTCSMTMAGNMAVSAADNFALYVGEQTKGLPKSRPVILSINGAAYPLRLVRRRVY